MTPSYDVVVVGGGPAGAAAALALAGRGRGVLLADAPGGPPAIGEALPAAARMLLRDLGAAGTVPGDGHLPCYGNRSVWGSAAPASVDSIRDPHGPGWHLDRPLFDRRLREAAASAGAEVRTATARPVRRHPDGTWTLALHGGAGPGAVVRCRWLVDATGRRAAVATTHGARRLVGDRLVALHLVLGPGDGVATDSTTLVEAGPDGWWYSAPLPGGRLLLAFFTDGDLPAARGGAEAFRHRLAVTGPTAARAAGHRFPSCASSRSSASLAAPVRAPAHTARLDRVHGEGWTAAGDAAAAFDPLSSQGILTALWTGRAAGLAVDAALAGDPYALDRYATAVTGVVIAYRRNHAAHYGLERRWPARPFWRRRHPSAPAVPAPDPFVSRPAGPAAAAR
ncbi:tryptophan 7-halogenase [Kitasatospora sp. NPDC057541]|uniref:tryptophan 7-halogenase n=1 Tax=Kitasatospora sp. NPDC057541 TaxID=3346161 RepID=UPI0036CF5DAB